MRNSRDPEYGTVEHFAVLIREHAHGLAPANRFDHVDAATTGMLRSVLACPGTDAEVRTWFRNALDAGDLVRAELAERPTAAEDDLGPSPAHLGETTTLAAGEWEPLDDLGTEIYVYGDQPVDVAVQRVEVDDELRRLQAELDAIGGLRVIEYPGGTLRVITRALHDRLCTVRIATPQEEVDPTVSHCAFCGFCYPRATGTAPSLSKRDVEERMRLISRTLDRAERDRMYADLEQEIGTAPNASADGS